MMMMMMSFICSFRNKNELTDIYPPSGYSLLRGGVGVVVVRADTPTRAVEECKLHAAVSTTLSTDESGGVLGRNEPLGKHIFPKPGN